MKNKKTYIIIAIVALVLFLLWKKHKSAATAVSDGSGGGTGSDTSDLKDGTISAGSTSGSGGTIPSNVPVYTVNRFIARSGGATSQGWSAIAQVAPSVAQNFKVGDQVKFPGSTKYPGTYKIYYKYDGTSVVNLYFDTAFAGDDGNARIVKA